ncbi:hypothetical protein OAF26_02135 [Akkermansiaceae bacterium]|nr:hypothetical protein [Akkermansiaceae bacterium]
MLSLFILYSCKRTNNRSPPPLRNRLRPSAEATAIHLKKDHVAADFANLLAPLIDPAKLDTLKGKRAAINARTSGDGLFSPTRASI